MLALIFRNIIDSNSYQNKNISTYENNINSSYATQAANHADNKNINYKKLPYMAIHTHHFYQSNQQRQSGRWECFYIAHQRLGTFLAA